MNLGGAIVLAATLASLAAFASSVLALRSWDKKLATISVALSLLTFVTVTGALLFLAYLFSSSDMNYYYVWHNSSSDLSNAYKISGVWAGAEGSFLLWIWFMALVLAVEVMLVPRRSYLSRRFHGLFQASMTGILFLFMLLLQNMNLFEKTNQLILTSYPNGYGLSLLLQTPEMVIHPPVVFAGYAFCIATIAAAVSYFVTGESNWVKVSLPWGRLAWIFLTLGIGIGAIWAYYVLGWGGYWGWDPVETSSLLPWLVVTAFLHTQIRHSRKGEYRVLSPALGMTAFVAVMFAAFATRAGSIWAASVHAFGGSVGETAGARFGYILENDMTVLGIFTIMVMLFVLALYMSYAKYRSLGKRVEQPEPERLSGYISDKNNMFLTVGLLLVTSAVMLLLLFKNVNVSQTANYNEFSQKMSIFFVSLMVALSICLTWKALGRERAFWLGVVMLVVSIVLAIVSAASDSFDWLVAFSLPSYALAVGASALRLAKARVAGSIRKTLQKASPQLVHLGVALVLVSFVISSNLQAFPSGQVAGGTELTIGQEVSVGDYTVRLADLRSHAESRYVAGSTVQEVQEAVIDILKSGDPVESEIVLSNLVGLDPSGKDAILEVEVHIHKSILNDLYIDFQWLDAGSAILQVKLVPMMNFLWAGLGLLAIGLAIRTVVWKMEPKETEPEPKKKAVPAPEKISAAKEEKDYESLVEEELRKFKEKKSR